MKSFVAHFLLLGCLCLAFRYGYTNGNISVSKYLWSKLILTQHWPVTVCKMSNNHCKDPPKFWTLHGLWPGKAEMCNKSWPFNISEVQDLLPELEHWWPDVLHPNGSKFWRHEWLKHGTCAAELECLNSQHKYFSKSLEMYKKVDLNSVLVKFGILPSASYYQMKDIKAAIINIFGVTPKIQCLPPNQGESAQTLGQIEICFTQEFIPRNCSEGEDESRLLLKDAPVSWELQHPDLSVCDNDLPTYYPPVETIWA
ncbi:ribonuclease T2 isoform X2 [Rhinatrema bivittatum]|uniref:ribonuclease T2 isoform X2 n=1 Tax=Rhinatrema bivittatum TaxID=194408 RepID=UPI001125B623|nr:ribonuclease T2 isoform X2 [Rhinatrema bivittatum]